MKNLRCISESCVFLCVCTKDGPQGFANAKCIFIMSNIFNPCFYFWVFLKLLTLCFIFILENKKVEIWLYLGKIDFSYFVRLLEITILI